MPNIELKYIIIFISVLVFILALIKIILSVKKSLHRRSVKAKTDAAGRQGEENLLLKANKLKGYKRILTNLYIPTKNGTTEIDLIVLSKKGILVFECKNMSGNLYGDDENPSWLHVSYNNSFSFFNPIFQNRIHITALKNVLKMDSEDYFHSVIVLNDFCGMKNLKLKQDTYKVIRLKKLKKTYRKYKKIFSKEDVEYIYGQLKHYAHASKRIKRNHIKQVSSK